MCISLLYINRKERKKEKGQALLIRYRFKCLLKKINILEEEKTSSISTITTKTIRLINNKLINIFETERKRK